jgi:hypothetical protein
MEGGRKKVTRGESPQIFAVSVCLAAKEQYISVCNLCRGM